MTGARMTEKRALVILARLILLGYGTARCLGSLESLVQALSGQR